MKSVDCEDSFKEQNFINKQQVTRQEVKLLTNDMSSNETGSLIGLDGS